ncbi:class I SAM-dependent methyltransferase [Kaarinaea lacus]
MKSDSQEHKKQVVSVFNTVAEGYDNQAMRFFTLTADKLVGALNPLPGEKVLDIAAGTGAVATSCAQAVSPSGRVTAIDLSESMLEKARQKARDRGLDNIDYFNMDAEYLDFDQDYFNHAICSFGLFFLPDMVSALKEWVRVVKPGGSLLFSSFTENAFKPMMEKFIAELEQFGVQFEESPLKSQRLANSEQCLDVMTSAGLQDGKVETHQLGYHLQCVDDWWSVINFSGLRGLLDKLDVQFLAEFKSTHLGDIQQLFGEEGLWMSVEVLISQGKVPTSQ